MGPMVEELKAEAPPASEVPLVELDDLDIEVDMDEAESDPVTDPVAPAASPKVTAVAPEAAVAPVMHSAEPAPSRKNGIGTILALSVGAALLLGGVVTWLALRPDDSAESVAEASTSDEAEVPTKASASDDDEVVPVVGVDDDTNIDPDAPGTIRVEGPVGGEAFINDESVGTVPAKVTRPPGLYTIRVEARGFEDWSADVQLQADGHAKLVAANTIKLDSPRANRNRRKGSKSGRKPSPAPATTPNPDPAPAAEPKPDPAPKKNPPPAEDDVFMKRGEKKDDGIFLPVGK